MWGDALKTVPDYLSVGGQGGGCVLGEAVGGSDDWFWSAPAKFKGNRAACYGGLLEFALKQIGTPALTHANDVRLYGAGMVLEVELPRPPGTNWTNFKLRLHEKAGWKIQGLQRTATQAEIIRVLATLSSILIRGDYDAQGAAGGLDNVALATPLTSSGSAWVLEGQSLGLGRLRLRWPAAAADFQLEVSDSLASPNWRIVSLMPVVVDGLNCLEVTPGSRQQFYRLRQTAP